MKKKKNAHSLSCKSYPRKTGHKGLLIQGGITARSKAEALETKKITSSIVSLGKINKQHAN